MTDIETQWMKWLADEGIRLTDPVRQSEQFAIYYRLLVEWNDRMNLTGITERGAVYEKHFYDSLTLSRATDMAHTGNVADIGSGAGFPSLPLKIVFPHLNVTIVDALAKRIRFLEEVVAALGLDGVRCVHGRAEDVGRSHEHRDRYDLVTARAVARLAVLNEFCLPFVRPGGLFVAMKGADVTEELEESRYSVERLNGSFGTTIRLSLPVERSERHLVVLTKKGPTPKAYPRKAGTPLKSPLLAGVKT